MTDTSPNPPKKPHGGAPKGNTNALKHGLYASHYTPVERQHLEQMPPMESIHEVHLLRLTLEKVLSMIESCEDEDRLIKLYNTLYLGSQRLMTAMRTNNILVGDNQEVLTSFWEAVELYRKDHDLK